MHIYYAYIVEYVGMYIDVHMCILVHVLSSFHLIEHNPTVGYLATTCHYSRRPFCSTLSVDFDCRIEWKPIAICKTICPDK